MELREELTYYLTHITHTYRIPTKLYYAISEVEAELKQGLIDEKICYEKILEVLQQ